MKSRRIFGLLTFAMIFALPLAAMAAGDAHGEHHIDWLKSVILPFINLTMFLVILVVALKKPLKNYFQNRAQELKDALEAAERAEKEAKAKLAEYGEKIKDLEKEREELFATFRKEAEAESERIVARAKERASKIKEDMERSLANELSLATNELREETIRNLVVQVSEIFENKVTDKDRNALADQAIDQLGGAGAGEM